MSMCWEEAVLPLPGMWPVWSKVLVPLVQDTETGELVAACGGNQPQELGQGRDDDVISTIILQVQVQLLEYS